MDITALVARTADQVANPARLADLAYWNLQRRRRKLAQTDPRWNALEKRRKGKPRSWLVGAIGEKTAATKLTLGRPSALPVSVQDMSQIVVDQRNIETGLLPDPWWTRPARSLQRFSYLTMLMNRRRRVQRVVRGWSDDDAANMNITIASTTAGMLELLAGAKPSATNAQNPEDLSLWSMELRVHAARLRRYAELQVDNVPQSNESFVELDRFDHQAALAQRGWVAEQVTDEAKESLRWVANNLPLLWR